MKRRPSACWAGHPGGEAGALLVEALVALALALVAGVALMQAEVNARSVREAARAQISAVLAMRTAHEAHHPLMAADPSAGPQPAAVVAQPPLAFTVVERPAAPSAPAGAGGGQAWSLVERSFEARWSAAGQRVRHWWTFTLHWQAPPEVLGWLDAGRMAGGWGGRRVTAAGEDGGDGPQGQDAGEDPFNAWRVAGQGLEEEDSDAPGPGERGPTAGHPPSGPSEPDPVPGEPPVSAAAGPVEPVERWVPLPGRQGPSAGRPSGFGPSAPARAARFDAVLRRAQAPDRTAVRSRAPGRGRVLQSGALRVDPAVLRDPAEARALQDWVARVVETVERAASDEVDRFGAPRADARPPLCDVQPVGGVDPHLAWRCLGSLGATEAFLLPRTGLPVGWVLCRFRLPEGSAGAAPVLQAPAPRVHAWIGLGRSGCPALSEPA